MRFKIDGNDYVALFEFAQQTISIGYRDAHQHLTHCLIYQGTPPQLGAATSAGTATCDSRDNYNVSRGILVSFDKAIRAMGLNRQQRFSVWNQYHKCCSPLIAGMPLVLKDKKSNRPRKKRRVRETPAAAPLATAGAPT